MRFGARGEKDGENRVAYQNHASKIYHFWHITFI